MNRATALYVFMILVGAAGIWAILNAADSVHAPPSIAGEWVLRNEGVAAELASPLELSINQSGRFLRIREGKAPARDYTLRELSREADVRRLALESKSDSFLVTLPDKGDLVRFERTANGEVVPFSARHSEGTAAEKAAPTAAAHAPAAPPILILLAEIATVLLASQLVGRIFERIGQPRVMGEMVAGIMLGPSLLGWLWPSASAWLFPAAATQYLSVLSQLGVIFFMFLIGLELDPKLLKNRGHTAVVVSHASIIAPFVLGGVLTIYLYPRLFNDSPSMKFSSATLFMGAAMSITAFPVLARILTERNLHKTPVGAVSITCAAVDDVTAWCLLAFVVAFARANGLAPAAITAGLATAYVFFMLFVVKPLLQRLQHSHERQGILSREIIALVFLLVLASAATTEAIGIHALFGAFLMGAMMPKRPQFVAEFNQKVEDFILIVLLPIFFAYTGLKTQIGLLSSPPLWGLAGLILLVACAGKFGGSTVAARICGLNWRESSAIGILMNTRGLMELVILNIGRELGVITDAVFAMMVLMAILTTFLTTPILNWVYPDRLLRAARTKPAPSPDAFGVLIPVSLPRSAKPLLRLADVITGSDDGQRNIVGLHLRRAEEREAYRAAVDGQSGEDTAPLDSLVLHAASLGIPLDTLSSVTRDAASDISRIAAEQHVRLILMGFHNPVIGQAFLGGTVHRVLMQAETDVAIFIDRGLHDRPKSIVVPFLGSPHDRLALDLAARMARHAGAAVTILHVVPSGKGQSRDTSARTLTERAFADPKQPAPVTFKVVEQDDPIAAVLEQAKSFDLVVIGVAEEWGLTSQLFGWRAERIARDCPSSLLIMRKHIGSSAAAERAVPTPGDLPVDAPGPTLKPSL